MGLNTTTKVVNDVITDVKRTFGDEASVQVSDIDIIRWTNAAQREILISNKILRSTGTTDITAGVSEYTLAGLSVVSIQSIHFAGRKVEWKSFQEAEEYVQSVDPLKTSTGDPALWYEWGGTINLYPVPSKDVVAGLTVYYIKEPTPLTLTSDVLSVPDSYFESILQFVLSKAYELDEDSENSQFKLSQFGARLDTLSEQENNTSSMTYPRITVLEEDL